MLHRILLCIVIVAGLATAQSPSGPDKSKSPSIAAWQTLDKGLTTGDPEHRRHAISALGSIGDVPEAVQKVERALKEDKDTLVRQTAAASLAEMGAREAIPALQAALDDNAEVSFSAAKALWELGDKDVRWVFQQVLEGDRKDTPGAVQSAMRKAKRKMHTPTELALMGVKEATGQFLGPASMSINIAQEVMKDGGAAGRTAVVGILSKDSDPYALTLLEWAVDDKSWAVRAAVAKALGVRGNQDTISKLTPLLSDDRDLVRVMAAASIVKLNGK